MRRLVSAMAQTSVYAGAVPAGRGGAALDGDCAEHSQSGSGSCGTQCLLVIDVQCTHLSVRRHVEARHSHLPTLSCKPSGSSPGSCASSTATGSPRRGVVDERIEPDCS